jgi:two-component system OmpR family response regulator
VIAMKTILFVEDDETLRENLADLLQAEGFRVLIRDDADGVIEAMQQESPDLALLDISLGADRDAGLVLCAEIRRASPLLPIVFFTAHDNDFDKISGMRIGADDYVTKTESLPYLVVRIKALLRRYDLMRQTTEIAPDSRQSGALRRDMNVLRAYWRERPVNLTLTQFWLVNALAERPGHVRSHEELMHAAKLRRVEPNTIAAHVKSIRRAFQEIDPDFACIRTERGLGYRWMED